MAKKKITLEEKMEEAIVADVPYEVSRNWVWTNLKSIVKFKKGKKPKVLLDEFCENCIPYVTISYFQTKEAKQYTFETETNRLCNENDVLIVWDGARAGLIGTGVKGALGSTLCKIKYDGMNDKFIYYYFLSKYDLINSNTKGTGIPHVDPTYLDTLTLGIPPLKEQQRIVDRIESLFEKLDKAKELIEEARVEFEKRKSAIFEKAFRGELTEKWRENNKQIFLPDYLLNKKTYNENYKYILPSSWRVMKLSDVAKIIMGQSPKGDSYNSNGLGIPLVNGPVEFGKTPFSYTIKSKWTTKPTKMCEKYDLLLCVRGSTLGKINIAGFEACIGRGVAAIRADIEQKYINYRINAMREEIYNAGTGTTFPNISSKQIAELLTEVPPAEEQKEVVRILDKLLEDESKIEQLTALEDQIELIKKSILAKAFRGEVGTNDSNEESALELLKEILSKE
ncbi:restriction endonuclease [Clostridium botulinum]|nr:restriction endonuclease [Clostridium botulinum]